MVTLLLYAALGGALYFVPLNLIQVQGYSATAAGSALLPMIAIMFVLSRWAGQLVDRVGPKLPLVLGPLIAAIGFVLFAIPSVGGSYWSNILPAVLVLGLGMTPQWHRSRPRGHRVRRQQRSVAHRSAASAVAGFGIVMAHAFDASLHEQLAALPLSAAQRALV